MRTNSGVKPKMKGNAVFTVLLFLLCTLPAFSNSVDFAILISSDTLILDGEIIEIKQKPVKTDTDSLESAGKKDVVKIRKPYLVGIGLYSGMTAGWNTDFTSNDSLKSVSEYLNLNSKITINAQFGMDVRLPIFKNIDLGIGYFLNTISIEGKQIDESTLCPEDERVSFENRNGELWQKYVVFIDPGYETREDQVSLSSYQFKVKTREVPINIRYIFNIPDSPLSLFAGGGVVLRSATKTKALPLFTYMINDDGEWERILHNKYDIITRSTLYQIDAGIKYQWTPSMFVTANIGFISKQEKLTTNETFNWNWGAGFLRVGIVKTFDVFKPSSLFSK